MSFAFGNVMMFDECPGPGIFYPIQFFLYYSEFFRPCRGMHSRAHFYGLQDLKSTRAYGNKGDVGHSRSISKNAGVASFQGGLGPLNLKD